MVVDKHVLVMSTVHLSGLWSQLIGFRPVVFSCFAMEVPHRFHIHHTKEIHAIFAMSLDMQCRNPLPHLLHQVNDIRELFLKVFNNVYTVLTPAVICPNMVNHIFLDAH
jgi:hypothetical protein